MPRLVAAFALAILAVLSLPRTALADSAYNSGAYSNCPYSQGCSAAPTNPIATPAGSGATPTPSPVSPATAETTGQLPSGLDFSINVTDGQTIPPGNFTVIITPLNGQGQTFDKVEIYLDGVLQASPTAASTGTYYWVWNTQSHPASKLTVILYDRDGRQAKRDFRVHMGQANAGGTAGQGMSGFTRAVRQIPLPLVYGFPYLLFILLLIAIGILVWQVRREVAESERLQALLAREQALAAQKTTFIQVASHYLRTPLTLINGGLDMAASDPAQAVLAAGLKNQISRLKSDVEGLLGAIIAHTEGATPAVAPQTDPITRIWLRPSFLLPLTLIAVLTVSFNLIIARVGQFEVSFINSLIQLAIFIVLTLLFYVTLRNKILHHRALAELRVLGSERAAIDQSRNTLIHDAATKLSQAVLAVKQQVGPAPQSVAIKTIKNGVDRFAAMVQTFSIAEQIKTFTLDAGPLTAYQLAELVNHALAASADTATAKHLQLITPAEDALLTSRSPELLQRTLSSIVQNAVAYSPTDSKIEITIQGGLKFNLLSVTDEGPGIPENLRQQLFEPFFRAEGALDFTHEGMGFSLYLDRLIMSYLGGQIQIEPRPATGLKVTLSLPA